ncbi:hypothetical protein FHE72_23410 (plasmid) [Rossellomorea vietnamensis]|uniref:Uncharacterized protein n=1 Tax=Rossellomorea vietnamensis TaxID=218284 RepID=A0A6I6UX17_9BACI|nr:hypothetical protein [Rossellomorea vietnamensis]QHE63942.1 hypothetical protein FHE72_23410 [Rossellomorea vietnamensis]
MALNLDTIKSTFNSLPRIVQQSVFCLDNFTDPADGRITINKDEFINYTQGMKIMAKISAERAWDLLEIIGVVTNRNGSLFNNFFINSEKDKGFHYLKHFNFFDTEEFLKNTQRGFRFEMRLLTQNPYNSPLHFFMEELYHNKTNEESNKINYFQHFRDAAHHVAKTIAAGHWELTLGSSRFYLGAKESSKDCYNRVMDGLKCFCSRDPKNARKTRIKDKFDRHKLTFKLRKEFTSFSNVYERRAPLYDLKEIAAQYGHDISEVPTAEVEEIHKLKMKLIKKYGTVGTELYRSVIEDKYFPERGFAFYEDCQSGKFAQTIEDIYIMPVISDYIRNWFKDVQVDTSTGPIQESLIQNLNKYSKHYLEDYPDRTQTLLTEISCDHEGLFEYAKTASTWFKALIHKVRTHQKRKAAYELEQQAKGIKTPEPSLPKRQPRPDIIDEVAKQLGFTLGEKKHDIGG